MQDVIKGVTISYWYEELKDNPADKVKELEGSLKNILGSPFLINDKQMGTSISLPRIEALSAKKDIIFRMSLINTNLIFEINGNKDYDEVMLLINEQVQLGFDILKDIYDAQILYSSIKIDLSKEDSNANDYLKEKLNLSEEDYENISLKKVFVKNDYYFSYIINSVQEFNVDITTNDSDKRNLFDRAMLVSLSNAQKGGKYLNKCIEINDRHRYNCDSEYRTSKNDLRGMIKEFKELLMKDNDELI